MYHKSRKRDGKTHFSNISRRVFSASSSEGSERSSRRYSYNARCTIACDTAPLSGLLKLRPVDQLISAKFMSSESKGVHQRQVFLQSSQNSLALLPLGTLQHIFQSTGPISLGFEQYDLLAIEISEEHRTLSGVGVQLICVCQDACGFFVQEQAEDVPMELG